MKLLDNVLQCTSLSVSPIAPVHSEPCSSSCVCMYVCEIPVFAPIEKQTFCDLNFFKEDFGNLRLKVSTSPGSRDRDELGRILKSDVLSRSLSG